MIVKKILKYILTDVKFGVYFPQLGEKTGVHAIDTTSTQIALNSFGISNLTRRGSKQDRNQPRDAHLKLEGVEKEVADDLGLAAHEEGERGGHEIPDEDLIVVERLRGLGVLRRHRPHWLAAVADDRPPQQPPGLPLSLRLLPDGRRRRHGLIGLRRRRRHRRVLVLLGGRGLDRERVREEDAVEEGEVAGNGGAGVGGDGARGVGWRGVRAGL